MKMESLVTVDQLRHGEYVLGSCTHNKSAEQFIFLNGLNPFFYNVVGNSQRITNYREVVGEGFRGKRQPRVKKGRSTYGRVVSIGKIKKYLSGMSRREKYITSGDLALFYSDLDDRINKETYAASEVS